MFELSKDLTKYAKKENQGIIDSAKSRRIFKFVLITCLEINNRKLKLNNLGLRRI